ncbi:MAG TPA: sugar ABC transporter substrate-binding protein [Thermopetrobacter sp.]|nr:sugar ABC transporter substrate-binding protein [Thermopetrobacter sp.]
MKRISLAALFSLALLLLLAGCASLDSPGPEEVAQDGNPAIVDDAAAAAYKAAPEYRIGVDDVVKVDVWKNPDLSVEVPVRPDGYISVPLIGDVPVGGKTPKEVERIIEEKLSVYLREPRVTVILSELKSHEFLSRVRITGAVQQPASIPYRQGMTVLDAVLEAGGVNKFASPDRTKLYRKKDGETKVYKVKLNRILKKGDLSTNYPLLPGDVITVPERAF